MASKVGNRSSYPALDDDGAASKPDEFACTDKTKSPLPPGTGTCCRRRRILFKTFRIDRIVEIDSTWVIRNGEVGVRDADETGVVVVVERNNIVEGVSMYSGEERFNTEQTKKALSGSIIILLRSYVFGDR